MRLFPLVALLAASALCAGEPGDWRSLFDGETTQGWVGMRARPFPAQSWAVEDGALRTLPDGSGGDIRTERQYADFELEFEFKIAPEGNSGLKYNVQEAWASAAFRPDLPPERKERLQRSAVGYEYQISDDERWDRSKPGWEKSAVGALYLLYAAEEKTVHPPGEWNRARIVVDDGRVEHWLNGEKLFEAKLGSEETLARVKRTKFRQMPGYGYPGTGYIALQHHGHPAWFRNLRIRELP